AEQRAVVDDQAAQRHGASAWQRPRTNRMGVSTKCRASTSLHGRLGDHAKRRRQLHPDGGSGAGWAREGDRAAERVDAIPEADQPASTTGIRTADAVV